MQLDQGIGENEGYEGPACHITQAIPDEGAIQENMDPVVERLPAQDAQIFVHLQQCCV